MRPNIMGIGKSVGSEEDLRYAKSKRAKETEYRGKRDLL